MKWTLFTIVFFIGAFAQSAVNSVGSGCALAFDGINNYVQTGVVSGITADRNTFTMECWFKGDNANPGQVMMHLGRTYGNNFVLDQFYHNSTSIGISWYAYGNSGNISCPNCWDIEFTNYQPNVWYHLAATFLDIGGGNMRVRFYVNGILIDEVISGLHNLLGFPVSEISYLLLGQSSWLNNGFQGQIDEVRIWNYARTETEIRQDMCRRLIGTEPGLVGYWRFDDCGGNIALDSSPNGNDGILY